MKKILTILFAIVLLPLAVQAQYGGKGSLDINAGIGLGSNLTGTGIPIGLSADYGINEEVTIGGYAGYASTSEDIGIGEWEYTNIIFGARGTYHKEFVENLDTYGGVMLGYNVAEAEWKGQGNLSASVGGFTYSGFAGLRYHFTDKIGVYGEVGYGIAYLQTGLTVRM
ncbi:DUF6646 family protein [Gracilimonas sp.]|uniref:DUF6646 family protein n=1 Tax=Gracilimonas sp. TaxID=1974203 RepID=UPI0028715AE2|nr:hypothetical protein [Gracilimonas sp.]